MSHGVASWNLEHVEGSAQELHDREVEPRRIVRINHVTAPALVLGSRHRTVSSDDRGAAAAAALAGLQVATRRSGGGAVRVAPGEQLWVDLVVPVGDPIHHDDITVASHRVGALWAAALGKSTEVWRGGMTSHAGQAVCFAALGPGEVTIAGRKLVGISQRRTREWSRFQCVAYHRWVPAETLAALDEPWRHDPEVVRALGSAVAVLADAGAPSWGATGSGDRRFREAGFGDAGFGDTRFRDTRFRDRAVQTWTENVLGRLVRLLGAPPIA